MACGTALCIPTSHPHFLGNSFGGKVDILEDADIVLILDTDVPWIDMKGSAPRKGARVFIVDPDPLKQSYGWSHVDAEMIVRADSEVALTQLVEAVETAEPKVDSAAVAARSRELQARHDSFITKLEQMETSLRDPQVAEPAYILALLRQAILEKTPSRGQKTLWLNEGISNYHIVYDHVRPDVPGSVLSSGGSSLGWALGAAVGAHLGAEAAKKDYELLVAVVGDGTFLFGVPSTAYWMARKYNTVSGTLI